MFKLRAGITGIDKIVLVFSDMPVTINDIWFNLKPGVYIHETFLNQWLLIVVKDKMPT